MPEAPGLTINKENIQEYQAVTLTCSSLNGNPPPQYTWSRNGTLLTYDYRLLCGACVSPHLSLSLSFPSSSLTDQVITTGNSSSYTFNATRLDNQMKYECEISNAALKIPIRLEQYLRVKCKHRRKK